jgi:Protein of unknown function (DUF742)
MNRGEWADPDGETTGGRFPPVIGSDGAAVPIGAAGALPGDGKPVRWAWDGEALPVARPDPAPVPFPRADPTAGPAAAVDDTADTADTADTPTPVRPYVVTGGRTRAQLELSLETLVSSLRKVVPYQLPHDEAAVLDLCRDQARSVAEIAALHRVPIGVAKVLIADLATAGLVTVHQSFAASGPDQQLMERVLGGLRRL